MYKYITAAATDVGIKRKNNQDSLLHITADSQFGEIVFSVLCDGMGGLSFGEIASATVINGFEEWFINRFPLIISNGINEEILFKEIQKKINELDRIIKKYGERKESALGTTIVILIMINGKYYCANIGDSRIYFINTKKIKQITEDHSLVARELKQGIITEKQAKTDKRKNILLQCIGSGDSCTISSFSGEYSDKCQFFLCSDGMVHKISDDEYLKEFNSDFPETDEQLERKLKQLIELNKMRMEKDNLSAIAIAVSEE